MHCLARTCLQVSPSHRHTWQVCRAAPAGAGAHRRPPGRSARPYSRRGALAQGKRPPACGTLDTGYSPRWGLGQRQRRRAEGLGRDRRLLSVTGETRQGNGAMRGGPCAATRPSARNGRAGAAAARARGAGGAGARRAVGLRVRVRGTCGSGPPPPVRARAALRAPGGGGGTRRDKGDGTGRDPTGQDRTGRDMASGGGSPQPCCSGGWVGAVRPAPSLLLSVL